MANGKKSKDQMSGDERSNFMEGLMATQRGLEESIDLLIQRKGVTNDAKEMTEISIAQSRLRSELSMRDSELTAFLADKLVVRAPTQAEVEQIKKVTDDIYRMQAASATATAIISAGTQLATQWKSIAMPA